MVLAAVFLTCVALLSGCASTAAGPTTTPAPTPVAASIPATTPDITAHTKPGRRAKAPSHLPASSVDSHTVQPQPPPGACHARGTKPFALPDRRCTSGAINPAVTQANIHSTICVPGYTRTVRPPESVTRREKQGSMAAYGDSGAAHNYEYDHLVSLELGGARNDPRNLWPEPGPSPNVKDKLENRLHSMVCHGQVSLAAAQREIATDWVTSYHQVIG